MHPEKADTRKTVTINQNTALHQSTSQFDTVVLPTAKIPVIASDGSILKCREQKSLEEQTNQLHTVTLLKTDINLNCFWELEEVQLPRKNDRRNSTCEAHHRHHKTSQRWKVYCDIPFKQRRRALGDSFVQAKGRLLSLERRLTAISLVHSKYRAFINEFMDLGHLEEIPADEVDKPSCEIHYLPHHCVFNNT